MYGYYNELPDTKYYHNSYEEMIKAFDEMRSNYQGTLDAVAKLQHDIDTVNNTISITVNDAVNNAMLGYINQIKGLKQMIDMLQNQVTNNANTEQEHYNYLTNELLSVNGEIISINKRLNKLDNDIISAVKAANDYTDQEVHAISIELEKEIEEKLTFETENIKFIILKSEASLKQYVDSKVSSLHALIESLENYQLSKDIKDVWQYGCNYGGLTAGEWYMLSWITSDDWNNSNITAAEWYTSSRRIFRFNDKINHMISPVTGKYESVQKIILDMFTIIKNMKGKSLTAGEYDALKLTAGEYDALEVSAYDYDWKGKDYVHKNNTKSETTTMDV